MDQLLVVIALTCMAGLAMPLGATIARYENTGVAWLEEELRHSVMAFGGGALLSAIALVLVPEAIPSFTPLVAAALFIAGGLVFMQLDIFLYRHKTSASQLVAMLADFIPESLALGAAFAVGGSSAMLLALLMMLQNLPEGFNAYLELRESSDYKPGKIIWIFAAMAMLGPVAGVSRLPVLIRLSLVGCGHHVVCCWRYPVFHIRGHRAPGAAGKIMGTTHGCRAGVCAGAGRTHVDRLTGTESTAREFPEYRVPRPSRPGVYWPG